MFETIFSWVKDLSGVLLGAAITVVSASLADLKRERKEEIDRLKSLCVAFETAMSSINSHLWILEELHMANAGPFDPNKLDQLSGLTALATNTFCPDDTREALRSLRDNRADYPAVSAVSRAYEQIRLFEMLTKELKAKIDAGPADNTASVLLSLALGMRLQKMYDPSGHFVNNLKARHCDLSESYLKAKADEAAAERRGMWDRFWA